jgi:hypothetical protein
MRFSSSSRTRYYRDRVIADHLQGRHVIGVYPHGEAPLGFADVEATRYVELDEDASLAVGDDAI